ncbi:MAG: LysM peptidoglycan-binding domain-containing protein [Anaerolineae bacterium]|nr:LysM peptidoglycan-binding domain-containing protein [Anaerolineae bacterium]
MKSVTITIPGWLMTLVLVLFALGVGLMLPNWIEDFPLSDALTQEPEEIIVAQVATVTITASETLLPATPLSTRTPTVTLRHPPTLELPTNTPPPSPSPTVTPTQGIFVNVTVEGIQGLPSPTTTVGEACEKRDDWRLEYEVQTNDTLTTIAQRFNSNIYALAEGNCLDDPDNIVVGQRLRVPGDALPQASVCDEAWEVVTPINFAWGIENAGQVVFNWRGPRAERNLVRIYPPGFFDADNTDTDNDGNEENDDDDIDMLERTVDLRQNQTWNLSEMPAGGEYQWQVIPLNLNFQQICPESPLWTFHKEELPPTATVDPNLTGGSTTGGVPGSP